MTAVATSAGGTGAAGPGGPAALGARPPGARTIDEILAAARAHLHRVTPEEALAEFSRGAVLVDIRPQAQRAREGGIPGAVIVERNVLEWRFDPASDANCARLAATAAGCTVSANAASKAPAIAWAWEAACSARVAAAPSHAT